MRANERNARFIAVPVIVVIALAISVVLVSANEWQTGTIEHRVTSPPTEASFQYTVTSYLGDPGIAISRASHYEYGPSVMKVNDSSVQMWFCGGGGSGTSGGDSVWYSSSSNYGYMGSWSTPIEVIRPSNNNLYLDYGHACDPSVSEFGGYYYIAYTGTPDWGVGSCGVSGRYSCDNRVFMANVPVGQAGNPGAYRKLVNTNNLDQQSSYTFAAFWSGPEYAPVPVIRSTSTPVWRRGTSCTGCLAAPYTSRYGMGQPSQLNVGAQRIWFTHQTESLAQVDV